jgi:aspartate carbamoyltransferase catalytic subunit
MKEVTGESDEQCLKGKILASLFFVPSLRTRFSFEAAMLRLGGQTLSSDTAGSFSSELTGSFEDTIEVVSRLADVIVLRHHESGYAKRAGEVSPVPIINGGDGPAQHPTQALIDLFTIDYHLGGVDGCSILMIGDLNSRSIRSLCYFLGKFHGVKIHFFSPDVTRAKDDIKNYLQRNNVRFVEHLNCQGLEDIVREVEVVYITQLSKKHFQDRFEDFESILNSCAFGANALKALKKTGLIMHPLPRARELPKQIDSDPRACYFSQTLHGLYLRMALLCTVLNCYPKCIRGPVN